MQYKQDKPKVNWNAYFWLLTILLAIFRLFLASSLDLSPDEAYYWEFSRRLDFSYYDHPPMVAYFIALFHFLGKHSVMAIRLPSIIGMFLTSVIVFKTCKTFFNNAKAGFWSVAILNLTPAGTAIGFITTPDTPLLLFWALGMYSFLRALESSKYFWWIITGFALGFGALSKYNMILFVPGIALTLLCFKRYRTLLPTGRFWIMVLLAALGTLPIIYWNATHEWVSFKFQFAHGFEPSKRSAWQTIGDFLGGQLGTIGLTLFPFLCYLLVKTIKKSWKNNNDRLFFLAWLAFPSLLLFTYVSLSNKVEANWPQIAYLSAFILVGLFIAEGNTKKRAAIILIPSILFSALAITQVLTLFIPIPPRKDISTKLHGWKELGKIIQKIDKRTGKKAIFIVQGSTLASLSAFYGKLPPERIAEPYCAGNFRIWWKNTKIQKNKKVVYVDDNYYSQISQFKKFADKISSETHQIKFKDRIIKTINTYTFNRLSTPIKLKPYR